MRPATSGESVALRMGSVTPVRSMYSTKVVSSSVTVSTTAPADCSAATSSLTSSLEQPMANISVAAVRNDIFRKVGESFMGSPASRSPQVQRGAYLRDHLIDGGCRWAAVHHRAKSLRPEV